MTVPSGEEPDLPKDPKRTYRRQVTQPQGARTVTGDPGILGPVSDLTQQPVLAAMQCSCFKCSNRRVFSYGDHYAAKSIMHESHKLSSNHNFQRNVAIALQSSAVVIRYCLSVVCLSSVTRVYCDKTTANRIMRFSLQGSQLIAW